MNLLYCPNCGLVYYPISKFLYPLSKGNGECGRCIIEENTHIELTNFFV